MSSTKIRYNVVRVADRTDDQKSSASILGAIASSVTQEDLQEFVLSQIKRIIHGSNPGNWNDSFDESNIFSLESLVQASGFNLPAICRTTDNIGDIVHIYSDSVNGITQVEKVSILDYAKMPGVGVIVSKDTHSNCRILRYGILSMGSLIPGKTYFVGLDGRPTGVRPVPPEGGKVFIQVLGVAMDSTRLMVNPSFSLTRVTT
jgi:hypothetical protein